jgi:hypothetical protein
MAVGQVFSYITILISESRLRFRERNTVLRAREIITPCFQLGLIM